MTVASTFAKRSRAGRGVRERSGAAQAAQIELSGVTKRFATPSGSLFTAVRDVDMTIEPGKFCAVVGPSGCGKSTTLTMVSGLDRPSAGTVSVGGKPVDGITAGTSFMFQSDALLPWKTVLDNVALGPVFRGAPKKEAQAQAREWVRRVHLAGFENHHPHQLSGGMRKRVSLAAALINEPSILLMDEPFGALDVQTKAMMSNELLALWEQTRPTVIFVTHDLEEAIALADQVVVMTVGPGTVKDSLRHRPAPAAGRGAGNPVRPPLPGAAPPHLGVAARRGRARVCAHRETRERKRRTVMSAVPVNRSSEPVAIGDLAAAEEAAVAADVRRSTRSRRMRMWAARIGTLVIIIGGWQLLTSAKIVDPFFWGQPSGIVKQLNNWVQHGTEYGSIWEQIWVTFKEAVLGFVFGVAAGIIAGVLLGMFQFLADVASPYIKVANAIPRIALGSLFTVALGLGAPSKVALAAVLVFFVVFFNAFQGVREVDRNLLANARVLGASKLAIIRHVVVPSALTWIIASLHVAFGMAIIGAIVGEFLGAQKGLGLVIASSQNNFNPNGVFAAIFIIAVLALTAEGLIGLLERRLLSWRPRSQSEAVGA